MPGDVPTRRDLITGRLAQAPSDTPEIHVSSLLVHARPADVDAISAALQAMAGVEIHGSSAGKIVVTLETASEHEVVQRLGAISELPGVLSATLVYHHFEPDRDAG